MREFAPGGSWQKAVKLMLEFYMRRLPALGFTSVGVQDALRKNFYNNS